MFGRILFLSLLGLSLLGGYPYAALVLNRIIGTSTATLIELDGRQSVMIGPNAPRPDWVPIMPQAWVITGANWVAGVPHLPQGSTELLSHASLDGIAAFYGAALHKAGCEIDDDRLGGIDPALAAWFEISMVISAWCPKKKSMFSVQIRAPSGIVLPTRLIELSWRRTGVRPVKPASSAAHRGQDRNPGSG